MPCLSFPAALNVILSVPPQLPQRREGSSDSDGLDDDASSTSSTSDVGTPRLLSRPVRLTGSESGVPILGQPATAAPPPLVGPLTAGAARFAAAAAGSSSGNISATVADGAAKHMLEGDIAAACELSESFGHERSMAGSSSYELHGFGTAPVTATAAAEVAALAALDLEEPPSSCGSSGSTSRSLSRRESLEQPQYSPGVVAAAVPPAVPPPAGFAGAADGPGAAGAGAPGVLPALR